MTHSAWLSIQQAIDMFGVSRSTLERRLRKGDIHQSQTRREGAERHIAFLELVRLFGEPKNQPSEATDGKTTNPSQEDARIGDTARLIERLEADLERERGRADLERERAERYERELSEARRRNDELTQRLLPAPRSSWFLARLMGRQV